ncbi:MAG: PilT/PilU family type 4a pilus ATPase [Verrucomicrobiales bacterium]|nr:PilT/PilU family type 4a pilus ATPase [Verrucomicrobiales bacterium]
MRRNELDYFLGSLLEFDKNVSDIIMTVGRPMQVEVHGMLNPVPISPFIESLTPFQTEMIALNLMGGSKRLTEDLLKYGACDTSYSLGSRARFRVNIFSQRGSISIVLRKLNAHIPEFKDLWLPEVMLNAAKEKTGLVLVTGATGSGKTTTLASLINNINSTHPIHIITLEDPVEFIYEQKKATINQRELGTDFDTFSSGLRAALRQAPKVILVGEMRDRATVEIALNAAETGHLVFSTLHTIDAGQTINRILGMFEQEEQEQVRLRLADTLRWVFSQRLIPKVGGGRFPLIEIMGNNMRTKETIVLGESEGKSFYEIIEASNTFGWRNFDNASLEAYKANVITEETAIAYCSRRGVVARGIDLIKKGRGEMVGKGNDLRMAPGAEGTPDRPAPKPLPPLPGTIKLKM